MLLIDKSMLLRLGGSGRGGGGWVIGVRGLANSEIGPKFKIREMRKYKSITLEGSFSAVSKPSVATQYRM